MTEISFLSNTEYLKNKADYDYLKSSMEIIKEKWKEIPFTKDNMERNIFTIANEMDYYVTKIRRPKSEYYTLMFIDEIIMEKFKSFQREIKQKYQFNINRDNIENIFASVQNEINKSLVYYGFFTNMLIQNIIMENTGLTHKHRLNLIYEFPHLPWTISNQEFYRYSSGQSLLNDEFMSFLKINIHGDWNYLMFFDLIERTSRYKIWINWINSISIFLTIADLAKI